MDIQAIQAVLEANGLAAAAVAAGLLVVLVLTLLSARRGQRRHWAETDALRLETAALREENAQLREERAGLRSAAERVPGLDARIAELQAALGEEARSRAGVAQELASLKETHAARLDEIRGLKQELEDRFKALASGVLNANSEQFLKLVSERFESHKTNAEDDLAKRHKAIADLVKPLDEKLVQFDQKIGEIEKARNEAYGAIQTQVRALTEGQRDLGTETRKLVQALRAPKTRGRWGEMQLRQVFEMAGMAEHVDYDLESTIDADGARKRPDAIVNIPGGKQIVVDAKTPLEGYLDALEAATPEEQKHHLQRHAQQLRVHVKSLASKEYHAAIPTTPDFVVMFIPGETFVAAAVEADPGVIEYAFENKVLIATPTTLMALVKAIAYGWQQERMTRSAAEVQRVGKEIYERLGIFAGHLEKVGRALGQSVDSYNRAVGSLESRVLASARKFEALGAVNSEARITAGAGVEARPRGIAAQELLAAADDQADTAESEA